MKDFTLNDLKQGMVLHLRNGQTHPMVDDNNFYEDGFELKVDNVFNNNLTQQFKKDYDIIKITFGNETVYERPKEEVEE